MGLGKFRGYIYSCGYLKKNILEANPDFFCLQEVTRLAKVQKWLGKGYRATWALRDCAIAWNCEKYELKKGTQIKDIRQGRLNIIDLIEKNTKKPSKLPLSIFLDSIFRNHRMLKTAF